MKKGWILTAKKRGSKNTASRAHLLTKEQVDSKAEAVRKKADGGVLVNSNTPYLEVDPETRIAVSIKGEAISTKDLLRALSKLEPLLLSQNDKSITVEINDSEEILRQTILESDYSGFEITLVGV